MKNALKVRRQGKGPVFWVLPGYEAGRSTRTARQGQAGTGGRAPPWGKRQGDTDRPCRGYLLSRGARVDQGAGSNMDTCPQRSHPVPVSTRRVPSHRRNCGGRSYRSEDGDHRPRQGGSGHSARPQRHLRSAADRRVSVALSQVRPQGRQHVCPRHDDPRDPGPHRGNLRRRGIAGPDLRDRRGGHGGSFRLAEPPLGALAIRSSSWTRSGSISASCGAVSNKAVFVALAVLPDGTQDVPGLWLQANEGAKFWARVLGDLRNPIVGETIPRIVS